MSKNICLLLEALSIIICLHYLYGEKFKFNIINTSYLTIHMIIMTAINYYDFPRVSTIMIYPVIGVYCLVRFGRKWKALMINNALYMVIISGIQLLVAMFYGKIFKVLFFSDLDLLIINVGAFLLILFILPRVRLNRLSIYLQDKERILILYLILCIALTLSSLISYKIIKGLEMYQYIVFFIGILLIVLLVGQLGKYKIKSKEIETELKMYQLYEESFHSLIEEMRLRQHEFDNHINTIYSLQYTCKTYDKLVNAQKEYSQVILKENRHNKILKAGNPLLIGFLYGKIIEIEKLGIDISYNISITDLDVGVPVYKLVEILGNLTKNAVEAMSYSKMHKALHIAVIEIDGLFEIEVRNKSDFIQYSEIENFFRRGFSRKGRNRGLGLYNVKNICTEYSLQLCCENKEINNENWLWFSVSNKRISH